MMNKKASVAKWVALAVVPLCLASVIMRGGQERRAKAVTNEIFEQLENHSGPDAIMQLISDGADVNTFSGDGEPLLAWAVDRGASPQTLEVLLDHGADVNKLCESGATPLMYAVSRADPNITRLFLSRGAKVSPRMPDLGTALHMAQTALKTVPANPQHNVTKANQRQIIQMLKAAGARE